MFCKIILLCLDVSSSAASDSKEPSINVSSSHSTTSYQSSTVACPPSHPFKQPSAFVRTSRHPSRLHPSDGVENSQFSNKTPLGTALSSQHSNKSSTSSKTCTSAGPFMKHVFNSEDPDENLAPPKFVWDQTFGRQ